jgi:hypothetical protein
MMDEIRKRLHCVPFVAFTVRTSGHEYSVPSPDHAHISPRGDRVVVYGDDDTTAILGPIHINSVIEQPNSE